MEDLNEIDEIVVTGGRPLHGSVRIQGSKNAALPVMAGGPFKLRDQCTAGVSEDHRCIFDGKNPPGAGRGNLVGGS